MRGVPKKPNAVFFVSALNLFIVSSFFVCAKGSLNLGKIQKEAISIFCVSIIVLGLPTDPFCLAGNALLQMLILFLVKNFWLIFPNTLAMSAIKRIGTLPTWSSLWRRSYIFSYFADFSHKHHPLSRSSTREGAGKLRLSWRFHDRWKKVLTAF